MKKLKVFGLIACLALVSCKEMKKDAISITKERPSEVGSVKELLSNYQKVFDKKNLADKITISLYKKSRKDKFANTLSHTFLFAISDSSSWDDLYGYRIVLQFTPIEGERAKLNDISRKRKLLSEYFTYDILEHLSRSSSDNVIKEDGKIYFKANIHSNLNHLESLNVYLQDKKTYKSFGTKISIKNYSLFNLDSND